MSGRATIHDGIQAHNERPAAVWSAGGRDYDQISRGIADAIEHCVVRLNPQPGERILDLATGTGWTSQGDRPAGRNGDRCRHRGRLAGRRPCQGGGRSAADSSTGSATPRAFRSKTGEFDAVVSTFGIMFASRPEAAAEELARVCRKGGRIALTTWAPDGNLFKMFQVMKRYMPPPPSPAPPSPFEWGRTERIQQLLEPTFSLRFEKGISYYREPSGEAAWETFSNGYGPTRSLAASLDPDAARHVPRGLRGVPRRIPHRARHLRAARILADSGCADCKQAARSIRRSQQRPMRIAAQASFSTCSITRRGPRSGSCATRQSLLNSIVSRDVVE